MDKIIASLKQPSTYAGIAALAAVLGHQLSPGVLQYITDAGMAIGGLLAVVLNERGHA